MSKAKDLKEYIEPNEELKLNILLLEYHREKFNYYSNVVDRLKQNEKK